MAIGQDDRALLQLLSERGQSYADLGDLLGMSEGAVREKARNALGELGGADPDAEVGLTDYLLGQADPIGRADAVRYLQDHPEALELAEEIATKLRAIAPGAQLPKLPQPRGRRAASAAVSPGADPEPPPSSGARTPFRRTTSPQQARLIAAIGALGVLVLVAILVATGAIGGGDDGEQSAASDEEVAAEEQREVTSVPLRAQSGSGVAGQADFGLANELLTVDLQIDGLQPEPPRGDVYVLWLMLSDQAGYPVTILQPDDNGAVDDTYSVPTPIAVAVGSRARFVQVSQGPAEGLQEEIDQAVEENVPLVPFSGDLLARGRIPMAEGQEEN
jgi:hypothetical protein